MKNVVVSSILTAIVACAASSGDALAQVPVKIDAPPAGGFSVERITPLGPGCTDPDAVTASFTPDGTKLVVELDSGELDAEVGGGLPLSLSYESCRVSLDVVIPVGYRFTIQRAEYRGYAYLDPLVLGRQSTRYWFLGTRAPSRLASFAGPFHGIYELSSDFGAEAVWSLCNLKKPLIIDVSIGLTNIRNPKGSGYMTNGGGHPFATYTIAWNRCGT